MFPVVFYLFLLDFFFFYFTFSRCVICMNEFCIGEPLRYLPCMHTYHKECIDDWLMRSFTCPSCMEPVDAALLTTYQTSWSSALFPCIAKSWTTLFKSDDSACKYWHGSFYDIHCIHTFNFSLLFTCYIWKKL